MADIATSLIQIGKHSDPKKLHNEIYFKEVDALLTFDLKNGNTAIYSGEDREKLVEKGTVLKVISSNGGNLSPCLYINKKIINKEIKKIDDNEVECAPELEKKLNQSFGNMKKYLSKNETEKIENMTSKTDYIAISDFCSEYIDNYDNLYLDVIYNGKSFLSYFPEVLSSYLDTINIPGKNVLFEGESHYGEKTMVGYNANLPYLSTNELPSSLRDSMKAKMLTLSKDEAFHIMNGSFRLFKYPEFKFQLFGVNFYLLPTMISGDFSAFMKTLKKHNFHHRSNSKMSLERIFDINDTLYDIIKESDGKLFLNFLFAEQQNSQIILYEIIEDIPMSRFLKIEDAVEEFVIVTKRTSMMMKSDSRLEEAIYLREYFPISNKSIIAKLILGKEQIENENIIIRMVYEKMFFYQVGSKQGKRDISNIIGQNGYFKDDRGNFHSPDDADFEKHQRLCNFFASLGIVKFPIQNLFKGGDMNYDSVSEAFKEKLENVSLLEKNRAKEFYIVGAIYQYIKMVQWGKNKATSMQDYVDGLNKVTIRNIERVYNKTVEFAGKYKIQSAIYAELNKLYIEIKENQKESDYIDFERGNIAFIMGATNFKEIKKNLKIITGEDDE